MRAIILAAGRGSRMDALTADRPKCLVELAGRPLLDWQAGALRWAGALPIGVVRGYRGELLAGRADTLFDNPRWAETNMVSSLACASEWLREAPCIVSYSDIFYAPEVVAALMAAPGDLAISYDRQWLALWSRRFADPAADAETFRLAADGAVAEIGGRPTDLSEVEGQYMGLLRFTPAAWGWVEALLARLSAGERDRLDMTGLLSRLIAAGHRLEAVAIDGNWGEVDSSGDRNLYEAMRAAGELPALEV